MLNPQQTVASLVLDHAECAPVFLRHRIDYCCHGDLSVAAAAEKNGIALAPLLSELLRAIALRTIEHPGDPRLLPTRRLVAHIVSRHHEYLRSALPLVETLAMTVASVHGERNSKLHDLRGTTSAFAKLVLRHLDDEEKILFQNLLSARAGDPLLHVLFVTGASEHLEIANELACIRAASDDFTAPAWACSSYRSLIAQLRRLDHEVVAQVHLEKHLLRPRFETQRT